jgi:23S rRNA pseudouridine1911/1915/1917 synthase
MNNFQVTEKEQDLRLDQFLSDKLGISRKKVKQLIDAGRVFMGPRKIIIASWQLQKGDRIEIKASGMGSLPRRDRYLKIYYEDPDLLVIEKPPGVACERTAQTLTSTVVDDVNDYLRRSHPEIKYPYVGLMHRLDRETSGLMVYTLSKRANVLAEQFKRHSIGRSYLVLVEGNLKKDEGRIDLGLVKDLEARGRKMKALTSKGIPKASRAVTHFRVVERYGKATLVEARLETGKTHQVRAHFASLGHPVVGDRLYGSKLHAPRQVLHAAYLEFQHPLTHKKLKFHSTPPHDFQRILEGLREETVGVRKRRRDGETAIRHTETVRRRGK